MRARRFRALTSDVEVVADGDELAGVLADLLATYPEAAGSPALRYRVEARRVLCGDRLVRTCEHPLEAAAAFELDLYQQAVAACQDGVVLHASAVVVAGRALVMTGASGAGKTTLALAMLDRGADYVTEECALIRADRSVVGLARPITRLPDDDGPIPAGLQRREIRRRLGDGRTVRRFLLLPPAQRIWTAPAPLAAVVLLDRDHAGPTVLERVAGVDAIEALRMLSLNSGAGALAALVAAAGSPGVHRLRSRTVAEAVAAMAPLIQGSPRA